MAMAADVKIIEQPGEDQETAVIVLPRSEGAGVSIESEVGCNSSEELVTVLLQRLIHTRCRRTSTRAMAVDQPN